MLVNIVHRQWKQNVFIKKYISRKITFNLILEEHLFNSSFKTKGKYKRGLSGR
jgi:hypothetical protein